MLWFGNKNKNKSAENVEGEIIQDDILFDEFVDDRLTEEEIIEALKEDDTPISDEEYEEEYDYDDTDEEEYGEEDETSEQEEVPEQPAEVVVSKNITTFDELCDYVCKKPSGAIQYLRREKLEAFQLREVHLRLATVWGNVSMFREYSERDYAKIALAAEVIENPEAFLVLPMLTSDETQSAIKSFCVEYYAENGKKYAKNPEKFAALVKENNHVDEWTDYIKGLISYKLERFCEKNDISFDDATNFEGN